MRTYGYAVALLLLGGMPRAAVAQAGVPGARLESGSAQRAADRAEAYKSVATFFAEWREAWNKGDVQALTRLYTDDATLRLPGQVVVQGKEPREATVRAALAGGANLSMSMVDFDSNGEVSILVARYVLSRDRHLVEGVMTAVMYARRSSWRIRVHNFDAPENAANVSGAATVSLVWRDQRAVARLEAHKDIARFFAEWREAEKAATMGDDGARSLPATGGHEQTSPSSPPSPQE